MGQVLLRTGTAAAVSARRAPAARWAGSGIPVASITTAVSIECADSAAGAHGADRLGGLDVLRLAGVCAVVWFHCRAPGSAHLVGQLVALLLLSCSLAVRRTPRSIAEALRCRARRLLLPWAFWWCAYAGVTLLKVLVDGWSFREHFHLRAMLGGTSPHLWYLPFVFVSLNVVEGLAAATTRIPARAAFAIAAVVALASLYGMSFLWPGAKLPFPFAQYVYAASTIPLGLAIGLALRRMPRETARAAVLLLAATLLAVTIAGLLWWPVTGGWPGVTLIRRYAIGTAAFVVALCWAGRAPAIFRRVTPLAMGVYLIHPLVHMMVLQLPVRQSGVPDGLLTLGLSLAAARILSHTPLRRFI